MGGGGVKNLKSRRVEESSSREDKGYKGVKDLE